MQNNIFRIAVIMKPGRSHERGPSKCSETCVGDGRAHKQDSVQELHAAIQKKQTGVKRKLSELAAQQAAMLAGAEQRVAKIGRRADKLPEVAKILQPLI